MRTFLYNFLNWYAYRFPFPHWGLKYLIRLLAKLDLLDKKYIKKTRKGIIFSLNLRDHIQRYLFWYGSYEKTEIEVLEKIIRPESVFLDIGANIGLYSLTAALHIHANNQIHSFEASEKILSRFRENISLNNISAIKWNHLAVSDKDQEKVTVFLSAGDNLGMTGLSPASNFSDFIEETGSIRIDTYVKENKLSKVDLVKIDIEGHELMALRGMQQTLTEHKPLLLIELKAENLRLYSTTLQDIYDFLEGFNYKSYKIISNRELEQVKDKSTEAELMLFSHSIEQLNDQFIIRE